MVEDRLREMDIAGAGERVADSASLRNSTWDGRQGVVAAGGRVGTIVGGASKVLVEVAAAG